MLLVLHYSTMQPQDSVPKVLEGAEAWANPAKLHWATKDGEDRGKETRKLVGWETEACGDWAEGRRWGWGGRALVGEVHRRETDQREEVQSSRLERKRESKVQHAATIGQPRLPLVSAGTSQTGFHGTLMLRGREKTRLHSQINLGNTRYHQLW